MSVNVNIKIQKRFVVCVVHSIYRFYFCHFPVVLIFAVWTPPSLRIHLLSLTYFSPLFCPVICVYYLFRGVLFRYLVRSGTIVVSVCLSLRNDSAVCVCCQSCRLLFSSTFSLRNYLSLYFMLDSAKSVINPSLSPHIATSKSNVTQNLFLASRAFSYVFTPFLQIFKYYIFRV